MTLRTKRKSVSENRIRTSVFRILNANRLCSIATVAPGNRAHINTAFFAYSPALELYFLSDPDSLHSRNLSALPSMAMTIFDSRQSWDDPGRGIQLFGTGRKTWGVQASRAERTYADRFPSFARWLRGRSAAEREQAARLRSYAFFRFMPNRVKVLDEAEFGGAAFVVARVIRRGGPSGRDRPRLAWHSTEVLVPGDGETEEKRRR